MRWVSLLAAASAALAISGCDKAKPVDCTSEDAQSTIATIVSEQIQKTTKSQLGDTADPTLASESKIRATVALIKVTLDDIRTTKNDPNSTKRYCEGTLKVVMPLSMLSDADQARQVMTMDSVTKLLAASGIERAADTLTHKLSYTVQPTDDRKKVFGEVEDSGNLFDTLGEIVASHLVFPGIQANRQTAAAQVQAEQAELAQQTAAQNQADLEVATAENKLASQTISEVWKAIPDPTRAQVLELQRAWIKKKTADCNIKAAETSTDPLIKEAARLRCDTEMTRARSNQLRELVDS